MVSWQQQEMVCELRKTFTLHEVAIQVIHGEWAQNFDGVYSKERV